MGQPDTDPAGTADARRVVDDPEASEARRAAVETGGMESDPLADTPPHASRRDVVTGGMSSDPATGLGRQAQRAGRTGREEAPDERGM